jgi:hypothetical protein
MLTFLFILIAVFIAVDLFVRFVIDPLASGSHKKQKVSKSFTTRFDPSLKLASETMYDGGKPHNEVKSTTDTKDAENAKDTSKNLEQ